MRRSLQQFALSSENRAVFPLPWLPATSTSGPESTAIAPSPPSILMVRSYARGSGATLTLNLLGEHVVTGGVVWTTVRALSLSGRGRGAPAAAAEMISRVRSELSITVKELASILRVERPTIYGWLRGRTVPYPRNRRRLQEL